MRRYILATVLLALLCAPLQAQVTARTATPEELGKTPITEVKSPMILEIPLEKARLDQRPLDSVWKTEETERFWCDKARVQVVEVFKGKGKKGTVALRFVPTIATDWYRQDIDLTLSLLAPDGQEIASKRWDDLTIGRENAASALGVWGSSSSKRPILEAQLTAEQIAALYTDSAAPRFKIVIDIQGDEEDED